MKKKFIPVLFALAAVTMAKATVDIEIQVSQLSDQFGNPLFNGSYIELISLGTSGTFTAPTSTSFITGTEQLISGFPLNDTTEGSTPGSFDEALTGLTLGGSNFQAGQQLAIVWFPTISAPTGGPGAGTAYGEYSFGSGAGVVIPSDSSSILDTMFTISPLGGTLPNSDGLASLQVAGAGGTIPEPSSYALLGGLTILGLVAFRRRFQAGA
jgi:hypothetical protein